MNLTNATCTPKPSTGRCEPTRASRHLSAFLHQLIAENIVEARIQRMHGRKQALADALFKGAVQVRWH